MSASVQQRMWQKLKSPEGRAIYNQRQVIVEPVFAQIKHVRGFRSCCAAWPKSSRNGC